LGQGKRDSGHVVEEKKDMGEGTVNWVAQKKKKNQEEGKIT